MVKFWQIWGAIGLISGLVGSSAFEISVYNLQKNLPTNMTYVSHGSSLSPYIFIPLAGIISCLLFIWMGWSIQKIITRYKEK